MDIDSILALVKAGRCSHGSHGSHGDHGHIAHAVIGAPGGTAEALCGTRPGIAASWSDEVAPTVTCPKCIKRMSAIAKKDGFYANHTDTSVHEGCSSALRLNAQPDTPISR